MKQFPSIFLVAVCLIPLASTPAWSDEGTATPAKPQPAAPATRPYGWYPPAPLPAPGYWGPPAYRVAPAAPDARPAPAHSSSVTRVPGYRTPAPFPGYGMRPVRPGVCKAELAAVREELQHAQGLLKDAGIALDREYTGKQETVAEQRVLCEQLAVVEADRNTARKDEASLTGELQAARSREEGLTSRIAKLQDSARKSSDERTELRKRLAASERQQAELKDLVRDMTAERTQLRNDLAARDSQLATVTAGTEAAADALLSAQSETTASRQQLDDAVARHRACLAQLTRRNTELNKEINDRASALSALSEAASARDRLQAELAACNTDLARFHAAIETPQQEVTPVTDSDADGVGDSDDLCPGTQAGIAVGPTGCALDAPVALEGVTFHYDSHDLTSNSHTILDRVAGILRQHPELRLEVAGHTDTQGDPEYNLWLSQQRADSVMDYLVDQGVDPSTLTARGYGPQQPIADNATREGLARNRRVELRRLP